LAFPSKVLTLEVIDVFCRPLRKNSDANDQQDNTTDQLSIAANPHMLLRSADKKDSEQSDQSALVGPCDCKNSELSALVSLSVIPSVPISLPPQGSIESGIRAQVGTSEIQSAGPKPLPVIGFPLIKHRLMYCLIYNTKQKPII